MEKIGEKNGALTIIAKSGKKKQGYLSYYYVRCSCGNIKRYRYDKVRQGKPCGMCQDFKSSGVQDAYLRDVLNGTEE